MSIIKLFAKNIYNQNVLFDNIISLEIFADIASPAVLFKVSAQADNLTDNFKSLSFWHNNQEIFSGIIDKQKVHFNNSSGLISLEARDKGALLLDNQVRPQTLWGANIFTVFQRHIGKHGFFLDNQLETTKTMPVYNINASNSCWEIFSDFTNRIVAASPFVNGNRVVLSRRKLTAPSYRFNNAHKKNTHKNFTSFSRVLKPYNLVSRYYLRGNPGEYLSYADNPTAGLYGITRERYLTPPNELLSSPLPEVQARFSAINRSLETYQLVCDEFLLPKLTETAQVTISPSNVYNLIITGYTIKLLDKHITTSLILKKEE